MIHYQTKKWCVDNSVGNERLYPQLEEPAKLLALNEVVAFPTETVYGLGANALSSSAVCKIFEAKGRPSDNPLIIHIAHRKDLDNLVLALPEKAEKLMDAFWPGPLTFILPRKEGIAPEVTAGLDTVGIRMPDHPIALALIEKAGVPIAAPSANRSGRPSPTTAEHVQEDLEGRIAGIVDGGPTGVGVESTVLDVTMDPPMILRPGGVTKEQLESVVGLVLLDPGLMEEEDKPRSPGMKYQHYAPQGEMWIIQEETLEKQQETIRSLIGQAKESGRRVGVLATEETKHNYAEADVVVICGAREDLATVARSLYDALRSFDQQRIDYILAESFPSKGVGLAIMNRLNKAAGHRIYRAEVD
ncbi:L-threonylcarbamoyladenylate synthase [Ammoniphilus sp. CFH 90114]|uniref:L-threonylcarbamoyladenylate synthase n=1 Tax=Ammoniphilus sp. CFH 90114 TaxID=2493665 RepID=UPI00100DD4E8|nr:L-threonylcarbamoyladenylate synthase [Ammoniphilus sp. CFH 90114]RXT09106.1 threonylcarbamoyl-AMP synthase [Ammoniphilus sp. CFH 90114]